MQEMLKDDLINYLQEVLGTRITLFPVKLALPHFLLDAYDVVGIAIGDSQCVGALSRGSTVAPPAAIKRHLSAIESVARMPAVLVIPAISAWNRDRLVRQHAQFIVPGNQMYLPALGVDLRNFYLKEISGEPPAKMSPAAEVALLALLHVDSQGLADIAKKTGYTRMTMSRAFDDLDALKLIRSEVFKKNRHATLAVTKSDALRAMPSPVKDRFFVETAPLLAWHAGLDALERFTDISSDFPTFAVTTDQANTLKRARLSGPTGSVQVETWRYDPAIFGTEDVVDRYSLYLSLRDSLDERVQGALEDLLSTEEING